MVSRGRTLLFMVTSKLKYFLIVNRLELKSLPGKKINFI